MKFVVDAQLPRKLSYWLRDQGYDSIHTLDLPKGNGSDDIEIRKYADREKRIVISKDHDFWDDHIVHGSPRKLLIIKTGNIINPVLIKLFEQNIEKIEASFKQNSLVELNWHSLIIHS